MKTAKVVSSMSKISLDFDENRYVKMMSDLVKSETEAYLNTFLQEKVLPITPVDPVRVNKRYGTREELSSNAGVKIVNIAENNNTPVKYRAYVYFGEDPVSKEYAIIQHEVGKLIHNPPARDKFLQLPFTEALINDRELVNHLAEKVNAKF